MDVKNLKKLQEELSREGIRPEDLINPSRRQFIVKSLKSSGSMTAVYRLGLVSAFLQLISKNSSAMLPFSFWKKKDSGGGSSPSTGEPGTLWAWGENGMGQLGDGTTTDKTLPIQIPGSWSQVAAGGAYYYYYRGKGDGSSLGIRVDGTLWGWGSNRKGQLGDGTTTNRSSPVQIGGSWTQVCTTIYSTFGIRADGTLWAWGRNDSGKLGDGTTVNKSSPIQIPGSWSQVAAGSATAFGIRSDGTLWGWGNNVGGSVGDGTTVNRSSPVQIAGSWHQVSSGRGHALGIRTDDTLWAWGINGSGQLGDGTILSKSSPIQIPGNWSQIVAGYSLTLGIRTNRTLWGWGENIEGGIGDGTSISKSSPVQVEGSWSQVSTVGANFYYAHVMGIRTDETLWAWGYNGYGQFGNGTSLSTSSPVQVSGIWTQISAGGAHSLGIKKV